MTARRRGYRHDIHSDRHLVGKGGPVNWNEGHPILYFQAWLRSKLNRLVRADERVHQAHKMLVDLVALAGQRMDAKSIIPAQEYRLAAGIDAGAVSA